MADEPGLFEIMYTSRAMRRLKPDPVPENLVLRLIEAAHQAPSGSNVQNGRWIVVRDPNQRAKLAELNKKGVDWYMSVSDRPGAALPHVDEEKRKRMVAAVQWQGEHLADVPLLVFACLEIGGPPRESFAAGAGAGGSIWPGVQNLLLTARALGLGATPTTLILRERDAVKEVLALPETIEPFCMIPVGYPTGRFGPVTRRPVEEIMRWDRWS